MLHNLGKINPTGDVESSPRPVPAQWTLVNEIGTTHDLSGITLGHGAGGITYNQGWTHGRTWEICSLPLICKRKWYLHSERQP